MNQRIIKGGLIGQQVVRVFVAEINLLLQGEKWRK